MTIDIKNIKFDLIKLIMNIDDTELLAKIEQDLLQNSKKSMVLSDLEKAVKPIRKNVTLEQIDKEQAYTPFNYAEFRSLADELELVEPIEELLEMLTK